MTNIFSDLYYHYGIPTLFSEQIKTLLELKHKIIEDNDDYTLYLIENDTKFMYFPDFKILHIKNNQKFDQGNEDILFSLERRGRYIYNEYYIFENRNPENVIKKLAIEKPNFGIPLLHVYSESIIDKLNIKSKQLSKFISSIDLIYTHLQTNNVKIDQYEIDKQKLIQLEEEELEKYIDQLNITLLKDFPRYCGEKLFPVMINNYFCLIDFSAAMLFKIVRHESNYKVYAINLNYQFIDKTDEFSNDKYDLIFQFLFLTGQNYHFIQQQITEAHLIFESQDNQLKFITPYMRSFEINQGVLIEDIFNKED